MYEEYARFTDDLTTAGMDEVITAGITASLGVLRSALMLYVLIAAVMVMYGRMSGWEAVRRGVRAMAVIALLQAATYGSYVRETSQSAKVTKRKAFMQASARVMAICGRKLNSPVACWSATATRLAAASLTRSKRCAAVVRVGLPDSELATLSGMVTQNVSRT
jgi:hypothetical protein